MGLDILRADFGRMDLVLRLGFGRMGVAFRVGSCRTWFASIPEIIVCFLTLWVRAA